MALRSTKITSEVITTCNRLFASSTRLPTSATLSFEPAREPVRYRISNMEKAEDLPEISFKKDVTVFQELQPCSQMEYQVSSKQNWSEAGENPFPDHLKNSFMSSVKVSDLQKAEEKMLKAKTMIFSPISRSFSMVSDTRYAKRSANEDCEPKNNPCVPKLKPCVTKQKVCKVKTDCETHRLANCKQSTGSNCKLNYLDPDCTKTFAPYPSYSELCAEELPEDPSECTQCPWRSCDEADNIKPKPKKRNYSTSASHMAPMTDLGVGPLTKPPCKPPPSPCEVRREIEKKQQKEKRETEDKKKKKGLEDDMHQVPILDRQAGQSASIYVNSLYNTSLNGSMDLPETTWSYLERESGTVKAVSDKKGDRKDQPPNCKVNITPAKDRKPQNQITLELQDKKPLKGDEGRPPPCPLQKPDPGFNVPCPKEPLKKPKYKKRPMRQAYYDEAKQNRDD